MALLLNGEIETLSGLLDILQREYGALKTNDLAAIEHAITHKQQQLAQVQACEQRRHALLQAAGFSLDKQGMSNYLRNAAHAPSVQPWQLLLKLSSQCQKQNQINGGLVDISRRHAQHVVAILRGQTPEPDLYGPAGETRSAGTTQTLATA